MPENYLETNVLPALSSPQITGSLKEKWRLKSIKIKNTSSCPMNSIYSYFFLITYHRCGRNSFFNTPCCLSLYQLLLGGGGMNATDPFSIWIRILLMAFSFPSVNRTSLTSAEIATWKKKKGSTANNEQICLSVWKWRQEWQAFSIMLPHLFLCNNLQSFFILCLHYFNHSIKSVNTFIIPFAGASILLSFCSVIALWQRMMVFWEAFICGLLFI